MQISSRFTIAVHLFSCLDVFQNEFKLTSEFIAGSVSANPVIIRKIIQQLKAANLVTVARGTGGVAATRPLSEITLLDVFRAVECLEGDKLFHFHENPNPACPVGRTIHDALDPALSAAQKALEDSLRGTTLADILRRAKRALKKK